MQSVPSVDVQRYAGQWFEQTRLPNFFQSGCLGDVVVNYRVQSDASIEVVNRCRESNNKINQVQGRAVAASGDTSGARLKVSFLPSWLQWVPFTQGDYRVVLLDVDYRYAVVSEPSRKYMWVSSRAPRNGCGDLRNCYGRAEAQRLSGRRLDPHSATPMKNAG